MKKFLLISVVAFLASCNPQEKKQYDFEIITIGGDTIQTSFVGTGTNLFSLKNGDITTRGFTRTLMSGVRSYKVTAIKSLGMQTQAEFDAQPCGCELRQIDYQE